LALAFEALNELGFVVWLQRGCGLNKYFVSTFEIFAKFAWRKSRRIPPYFHGGNLAAFHL